jgi:hypothetical protein
MLFDASLSDLSNAENRSSLYGIYQKLFEKYSFTFFEINVSITVRHAKKTILSEFRYYNFS